MSLKGKRIVVIGGSSGFGLATAKAATKEGADVIIASRSIDKLERAKKDIGGNTTTKVLDTREESQLKAFFNEIGKFDHLIVSGSVSSPGSCLGLSSELARMSFDSKFWGQYFAVKYGAPHLAENGSIVLFSGVLSQRPELDTAVMSAVNCAVEGLARALAIELAPIRVNVISPGYVDTPLFDGMKDQEKSALFENIAKQLPVGRIGQPEEIAQSVLYLLASGYTTGSTLIVDGGHCIKQ